jgi:hypothetical protein
VNKNDEECGLITMSILIDLRFHLQGIDDLDESWENHESTFGKQNIIRAHWIKNQVMYLGGNYLPFI